MPSWEKRFVAIVGSIPWRSVVETKKYMYLHNNVMEWDDSACKEAFDNAKNRFWAEINGLPCNIGLPDPDMYIDDIDWNSTIDPELILDLKREPALSEQGNDEGVIIGNSHILNQSFYCTGWGEAELDIQPTGWDDTVVNVNVDYCNTWRKAYTDLAKDAVPFPPPTGWEDSDLNVNSGVTGWGDARTDLPKETTPFPPHQGWNYDPNVYGWVDYSTGWGEAQTDLPNATNPFPAPQGWGSGLQMTSTVGSWEQYGWQSYGNEPWRWNDMQHRGHGNSQRMSRGRGGGNWGSGRGRNMSGNQINANAGNEYQTGGRGGGRSNRGRKRGGFGYGRSYGGNIPSGARWEAKIK